MTDRPQPPQGHQFVVQEVQPDGSILWMPSVPADRIGTLLVWNPWHGKWEKPRYLCRDIPAILCYEEVTPW